MLSANSATRLTTAAFRAPGGQQVHGRGLSPDEAIPDLDRLDEAGSGKGPALPRAIAILAAKSG